MSKLLPSISPEFVELQQPAFHPYVFVQTALKRPTSIANAAWAGNTMKYLECDSIELTAAQRLVREHFAANQGVCSLYGSITGYLFVKSDNLAMRLDVNGEVLESLIMGEFWPPSLDMNDIS